MINQVEAAKSATGKVFWRLENAKALLLAGRVPLILFVSAAIALLEPVPGLAPKAHLFLATLFGAVALWMIAVVAEYIVGLLLLLSWVVLDIVPVKTALGGFSQDSWFFCDRRFGHCGGHRKYPTAGASRSLYVAGDSRALPTNLYSVPSRGRQRLRSVVARGQGAGRCGGTG